AVVFEGACRKLKEAEAFAETAAWLERPYRAIYLSIPDAEVEKRLAVRKGVEGRQDDASDAVEHRMREYEENTAKAVEYFKSQGVVIEIRADQPIEAVHADIIKALGL
ncbi:MAG TPA: nucleoside monophosphate kinase, partial [Candidatus Paceibacterota bacterium]|nr:nucleoside monophosphate kinase [Candidatus Paceibacterota bacterium]